MKVLAPRTAGILFFLPLMLLLLLLVSHSSTVHRVEAAPVLPALGAIGSNLVNGISIIAALKELVPKRFRFSRSKSESPTVAPTQAGSSASSATTASSASASSLAASAPLLTGGTTAAAAASGTSAAANLGKASSEVVLKRSASSKSLVDSKPVHGTLAGSTPKVDTAVAAGNVATPVSTTLVVARPHSAPANTAANAQTGDKVGRTAEIPTASANPTVAHHTATRTSSESMPDMSRNSMGGGQHNSKRVVDSDPGPGPLIQPQTGSTTKLMAGVMAGTTVLSLAGQGISAAGQVEAANITANATIAATNPTAESTIKIENARANATILMKEQELELHKKEQQRQRKMLDAQMDLAKASQALQVRTVAQTLEHQNKTMTAKLEESQIVQAAIKSVQAGSQAPANSIAVAKPNIATTTPATLPQTPAQPTTADQTKAALPLIANPSTTTAAANTGSSPVLPSTSLGTTAPSPSLAVGSTAGGVGTLPSLTTPVPPGILAANPLGGSMATLNNGNGNNLLNPALPTVSAPLTSSLTTPVGNLGTAQSNSLPLTSQINMFNAVPSTTPMLQQQQQQQPNPSPFASTLTTPGFSPVNMQTGFTAGQPFSNFGGASALQSNMGMGMGMGRVQ